MIKKLQFWLKNARAYTIPITTLSWLVAFDYAYFQGGNAIYGVVAWLGISLVHLATNLIDDYFDFKHQLCTPSVSCGIRNCKCAYLKDGNATIEDLRNVIITFLVIAGICGIILFFTSGWYVGIFALIGLGIALSYPYLSSKGFGDIAVITAYGPLMFEGTYYAMTGKLSWNVLILSFACAMFVETILYVHMLMDYDDDLHDGKTTLCTKLGSKSNALKFLMFFYILGYILLGIMSEKTGNRLFLFTFLTIPFVLDLYNTFKTDNPKTLLPIKIPENNPDKVFFTRFIYTRNIFIITMFLTCVAVIFG